MRKNARCPFLSSKQPAELVAHVSAIREATWVVLDRNLTNPTTLLGSFPSMSEPNLPERTRFEQALKNGFELVATEGIFELRRRVLTVDATVCNGIMN
jgi:hypothetical protein